MRLVSSLFGAFAIGSAALAVGCAAPSGDGSDAPNAPDAEITSQAATAVVVVERTAGPGDAVHADSIVARFVRVRQAAVDDQALRMAGATQDLPAAGTCSANAEASFAQKPRAVELLDVGPVTVTDSQGRATALAQRAMPDPAGFVSGVFYSGRSSEAFTAGSPVEVHASGGPDLPGGFVVSVPSSHELTDVTVAPTSGGLDITWSASNMSDASDADERDLVYVEVLSTSGNLLTRCTAPDTGKLNIAANVIGAALEGQLAVHRLHHEAFRAQGIDSGEVRFDLARVVPFHR
ncbi:MAG: hypothetical protein FWD73_07390 [Polyangiaceae bacterium]|nr:hypothetical protein [Polyangiaceae bacterium]